MNKRKQKVIQPGINFARAHLPILTGNKTKLRRRSFYNVKNSLDFPELCQATDFINRSLSAKFSEFLFGNPLPTDYSELGNSEFSPASDNFKREINWTILSIRKYAQKIETFLTYKDDFERNFLLGKYYDAELILTKIEKEICCSLWTLENRFLLLEFSSSTSDNKEILSKFNSENHSKYYTKSLAHYLSLRAERSLSVNRFNADLEFALSKIEGDKKDKHAEYYLFKLSFINHLKFKNYTEILAYDFQHTIIDRYLNLRKVFISLLTTANQMLSNEDDKEEQKAIQEYLINRLNYLTKKVNDPILFKLKLFAGDKMFPAFNDIEGKDQIDIIDQYTKGNYYDVEKRVKDILLTKNPQFDFYEIYIKSLVYQRKLFSPIGNPKSLQNQILAEIYKIVSISVNTNEAGINLARMANNLTNCTLSYGIINFVFHQTRGKTERKLISRLSFNAANPIIHEVFSDKSSQLEYLKLLKDKFPSSITISLLSAKLNNPESIYDFKDKLPDEIYRRELAQKFQRNGQYAEAAEIWEILIDKYQSIVPLFETALINLFTCYEQMKKYDDCIKLFVDSFFVNPFIIEKIDVKSLLLKIKENRFKIVKPTIDLPIFYTISNADENEIHIAFEKYNLNSGVCKPSELLTNFEKLHREKAIFYLKFTCGPEILKHSIHINGSKDRLEERLAICQFLRDKDVAEKPFYDDEIKYISNILVIQKGLMELDESKIYVNEPGIISNELKEYDAVYQRFKAIAKIAEKSNLWMLDLSGRLTTVNYSEDKAETTDIEYSSNPVYDIYKELFDAIKEKFLYSKFGIVAYLSTRIRHGVLLGELRPIFEKHRLITLREADSSNYRRNFHWDMVYANIPPIELAMLQDYLKEFSYSVDGLIFDLIKKYLQVYDENTNPDGWFNYDFSDDDLFWFSIRSLKTRDFNHFAQEVFEILWDRTDVNLNIIRERIQLDTSTEFNKHFDKLELDISALLSAPVSETIVSAIKACSTETITAIARISRWFKRSGTSASDFQLNSLIDIVMEYTNKSQPNKIIHLDRDVQYDEKLKGEYLTHFADLLRIFTENILKHADDKVVAIPAKITIKMIDDDVLGVSLENDITDKNRLEALKNVWKDESINILKLSSEGKSGYHKAYKILKSDLKCEDNSLETAISAEEDKFNVVMFINLKELRA